MRLTGLDGAELTITGQSDGQPVTLRGKVKNVVVKIDRENDYCLDALVRGLDDKYSLEFDTDNPQGVAYTLKVKGSTIDRTARIEATDRTAAAIERARVRVGAPENAKFRLGRFGNIEELATVPLDKPTPIEVEFYWQDKVYT